MVSTLCLACGLCCEGSLFLYLRLTEPEAERMAAQGSRIFRRKRLTAMRLGCPKLEGARCTFYEERPGGCRSYFCQLVFALREGRVGLEEALARVGEARELIAEVECGLAPTADGERTNPMQRAQGEGLVTGPHALRRAEAFLRKHFIGQ